MIAVPRPSATPKIEACILLGGLSQRMGRDKAALRLGRRTLTSHIRAVADAAGLRVRIFREDSVTRCGPLGGILTAFHLGNADAYLFLACDMPFVSERLLSRLLRASRGGTKATFASAEQRVGFPCLIPRSAVELIEQRRAAGEFSMRSLAKHLHAATVAAGSDGLFNINTPADLAMAKHLHARRVADKFPRDKK